MIEYDRNYVVPYGDYIASEHGNLCAYVTKLVDDKFGETLRPQVSALSDEDLLNQTLYLANGDDYDGCHTAVGKFLYDLLEDELRSRFLDGEEE